MTGKTINQVFLDTNLWYLYAKEPPDKYRKAEELIKNNWQSIQI